ALLLGRGGRAADERGEHVDFGEAGAQIVVEVVGDSGAFLFYFATAFGPLALVTLNFELARAFGDLTAKRHAPDERRQRDEPQRAGNPQNFFQRPPRRRFQQMDVGRLAQLDAKRFRAPRLTGQPFAGLDAADTGDRDATAVFQSGKGVLAIGLLQVR